MKLRFLFLILASFPVFASNQGGGGGFERATVMEAASNDYLRAKLRLSIEGVDVTTVRVKDKLSAVGQLLEVKMVDSDLLSLDESTLVIRDQ
ncbi:hypothetical protein [Pseudobacteriovorax antillogorgiicola]|uniref:Uncharacterized protein n=1 Tax=Pseudobacteriovorax antillogorgiicola TaxID=1513793 RepID=A0A1Y6CHB8_9BACT|nr:hypothetical protein [Pseudobacteriovorax antillogorgiicola]TCS48998.1 hypothetical protein EDD56_11640 [Pseudobacteriovorax antillogorgiicola]SMF53296.1 hypothetical protein SAMN06296036_116114 [Pseudobacteriovorax antillogorgiicola]